MYDNCNMFYVLILFRLSAVLGSIDVISGSKTTLFSVARGKRFTSSFGQFISRSKIDCCRECVSKSGCLSVNFSNLTNVCEFVALPSLAIQAYSRTETSWNIYATDGTYTITPCFIRLAMSFSPLHFLYSYFNWNDEYKNGNCHFFIFLCYLPLYFG